MVHTGAVVVCEQLDRRSSPRTIQDQFAANERRKLPLHLREYIDDGGIRTHPRGDGVDVRGVHQQPPLHLRPAHADA